MPEQADGVTGERRYRASGKLTNFTAMPNDVLRRTDISGNAKALYAILLDIVVFHRDEPDLIGLGQLLGGSEKIARAAVRELVDVGLLESKRRGQGNPNSYTLREPPEWQFSEESDPPIRPIKNGQNGGSLSSSKDEVRQGESYDSPDGAPKLVLVEGRNLPMDALVEVSGIDPDSNRYRQAAAALNTKGTQKGIRDLCWIEFVRVAGDDPVRLARLATLRLDAKFEQVLADRVRQKATVYRERLPGALLTPTALRDWWLDLATVAVRDDLSSDDIRRMDLDG